MWVEDKKGQLKVAANREEFVRATAKIYKWEKIREDFKRVYSVMFDAQTDLESAFNQFDPDLHTVSEVSKKSESRRADIDRILGGDIRPPYPRGMALHFEDIKYFLGKTPIDVVLYGVENPLRAMLKILRHIPADKTNESAALIPYSGNKVSDESIKDFKDYADNPALSLIPGVKKYDTGTLAFTALRNVGVEIRRIIGLTWDDTCGSQILHQFTSYPEYMQLEQRLQVTEGGLEGQTEVGTILSPPKQSRTPIIILENRIGEYGMKHAALKTELSLHLLGIDYGNLVFSFVGEKGAYRNNERWTGFPRCIKNELSII